MKKTTEFLIFAIILIAVLVSCRREEISIRDCEYETYVSEIGETCLGIYLSADIPSLKNTNMTVKDPSGDLLWTVKPEELKLDGVKYIGYEGIAMPKGFVLPEGKWTVELIYQDGRVVSQSFTVVSDNSSD